jgi:hypothetical protein
MRLLLCSLLLAVASQAATRPAPPVHPVKQKVAKPGIPKNRRNKVKGRKAPKPQRHKR